ncbi:MAG: flagellar export protein FliJ [Rubrivivax sp.]
MSDAPSSAPVLQLLLEQAEQARDTAQADWQRTDTQARQAHAQSEQLERYRHDYTQRWGARSGRTGSVGQLQALHGFLQRLEQALVQQRQQCELAERRAIAARAALLARERRVASVLKLLQRRAEEQRRQATRQTQKHDDEAAQRAWFWNRPHRVELR